MKQIYDENWSEKHRLETITGVIFTVIVGLLIAWSLGGCVSRKQYRSDLIEVKNDLEKIAGQSLYGIDWPIEKVIAKIRDMLE